MGRVGGRVREHAARLAEREHAWSALLLGAFVLVYLWPVLVGGDVLSSESLLFAFHPWASEAPADVLTYTNLLLVDVPRGHLPWAGLARDLFHEGTFPAWSQHAYGGIPFFASLGAGLTSPFSVPMWVLPLDAGIAFAAAIKLWVAAFGTYLLARELRLGVWAGLLAGISFALCSFNVVWLGHQTLVSVAAMLPWAVLLTERTLRRGGLSAPLGLALVTAIVLLGGHPATAIHVLLATAVYALVRAGTLGELERGGRARRLGLAAGALLVGALLVAVVLVPAVDASRETLGLQDRSQDPGDTPALLLPFGALRTALFPDWWGRPSAQSLGGPLNYSERTFYAGGVAILFALFALISRGSWRRKAPLATIALVGAGGALRAPLLGWFASDVPLMRQAHHQRMLLLFVFGVALLAGFGLQRLIDAPRERARMLGVLAAGALVGLLALVSASVGGDALRTAAGNVLHLRHAVGSLQPDAVEDGSIVATSVGWWLALVLIVLVVAAAMWRAPRRWWPLAAIAFVALAALDVQRFAHGYQPMQPPERVRPPETEAIAYLREHRDEGRFVGVDGALPSDAGATYGLRDLGGYEPPFPSLRWARLGERIRAGPLDGSPTLAATDAGGMKALSVLGVRFVVAPPGAERAAMPQPLVPVHEGDDASIFANPDATPRALVARRVVAVEDEAAAIATIAEPGFRPRTDVVVEHGDPALADAMAGAGTARVVRETNATVTMEATLSRSGLVVLGDALARGWSVQVDGRPAPVVRANSVMRGVVVDAGRHEVVWSYRVPGLRLGLLVSVLTAAGLAAGCAVAWRRRRRETLDRTGGARIRGTRR